MNFKRKYSASLLLALITAGMSTQAYSSNEITIPDTDGDTRYDNTDNDDDNDGITDTQEFCQTDKDYSKDKSSVNIKIVIDLDTYENNTSWTVDNKYGMKAIEKSRPYHGGDFLCLDGGCNSDEVVTREFTISNNGEYILNMYDAGGLTIGGNNGMNDRSGFLNNSDTNQTASYKLYIDGVEAIGSDQYPNFGTHIAVPFTVDTIPLLDGFTCLSGDPSRDDDGDGIVNYRDEDYAIANGSELNNKNVVAILDFDGDGIINSLDLDSDGDGIPDNVEAQTTKGFIAVSASGSDNDGINRAYSNGGKGLVPVNTDYAEGFDNDLPDFLDTNSDDDIVTIGGDRLEKTDSEESGLNVNLSLNVGPDGISDSLGASYAVPNGIVSNPANDLTDSDGDAHTSPCALEEGEVCDVDYRDAASDPHARLTLALNLINDDNGFSTKNDWTLTATSDLKTIQGKAGDSTITRRALGDAFFSFSINDVSGYIYEGVVCVGMQDALIDGVLDLKLNQAVVCTFTVNDIDEVAPIVTIDKTSTPANASNATAYSVFGDCGSKATDNDVIVSINNVGQQLVICSEGRWAASFDVSGLEDGADAVVINAAQDDESENEGSADQVSYDKDTVNPEIVVSNNGNTSSTANSITFAGTAAGESGEVLTILVKRGEELVPCAEDVPAGTDWTCEVDLTPLGDGDHTIQPAVADAAGNITFGEAKQVTVSGSGASSEFKTSKSSSGGAFNLAWLMLMASFLGLSLVRRK